MSESLHLTRNGPILEITLDRPKANAIDAKNVIANWSKMKEAEVVVRRHAHLENIRVNVLNN